MVKKKWFPQIWSHHLNLHLSRSCMMVLLNFSGPVIPNKDSFKDVLFFFFIFFFYIIACKKYILSLWLHLISRGHDSNKRYRKLSYILLFCKRTENKLDTKSFLSPCQVKKKTILNSYLLIISLRGTKSFQVSSSALITYHVFSGISVLFRLFWWCVACI
jgi:hypothetical protein